MENKLKGEQISPALARRAEFVPAGDGCSKLVHASVRKGKGRRVYPVLQ